MRERASVAIHLRKKLKSFAFDLALRILLHLFVWSASLAFSKRSLSSSLGVFFTCSPPPSAERFFFLFSAAHFFLLLLRVIVDMIIDLAHYLLREDINILGRAMRNSRNVQKMRKNKTNCILCLLPFCYLNRYNTTYGCQLPANKAEQKNMKRCTALHRKSCAHIIII